MTDKTIKTKKYEITIRSPKPDAKPARVARDGPIGLPRPQLSKLGKNTE